MSPVLSRRVLLWVDEEGGWVAEVPSLPGCLSQGETRDEALANIQEAISLFVEVLEEKGQPVPSDDYQAAELVAV